jgi:tagaturonate reductase
MQSSSVSIKSIQELPRNHYPVKILQFGSGKFLRAFTDWMVQIANDKTGFNAGVSIVQSISTSDELQQQVGVFTVLLKGIMGDEFVSKPYKIDVIQRVVNPNVDFEAYLEEALNPDLQIILSNTTEAGIIFSENDSTITKVASTFPGKLTQLLFHRYQSQFDNSLLVLPTELIDQNGVVLKRCVLDYCKHWNLPVDFINWLNVHVTFCNTLVDRIVSGFPKKPKEAVFNELGYKDELVVEGEWFHLWVIEGPRWIEELLPFKKAGLNVIFTHDLPYYQLRKVRILNGAHTGMACMGYLAGLQTVREAIEHPVIGKLIKRMIYDDIIPNIPGDIIELEKYADEVINRFRNPAIDHQLISISLNSISKFNVRVLPTLLAKVEKTGKVPDRIVFALAAIIFFYRGHINGKKIPVKDGKEVLDFFSSVWKDKGVDLTDCEEVAKKILGHKEFWSVDLNAVPELSEKVSGFINQIGSIGVVESIKQLS